MPGQNEVLWLNFVCCRNQATDLRNLHKQYIILAVEEKQNLHTVLLLFNLLFSFKCENIFYWHLFHCKGDHDSFIFHKEAEQL